MSDNKFKFGNSQGLDQKIIDFNNIQRTGSIELRPLKMTRHKRPPDVSFRCFMNSKTNTTHGIPIGKNPDGTYKFKPIRISGTKTYNLTNEQDAMEWAVVKDYYRIKGGDMERDPLFEVYNKEVEAEKEMSTFPKMVKAGNYVTNLSGNKLIEFGRLFGVDPHSNSPVITMQILLEIAKTKPQNILEKMESDSNTSIHVVLKRALATGIIKHSLDKGYVFKDGIPLGVTEQGAIETLRKDMGLLGNIDIESKSLDKFYVTTQEVEEKGIEKSYMDSNKEESVSENVEKKWTPKKK